MIINGPEHGHSVEDDVNEEIRDVLKALKNCVSLEDMQEYISCQEHFQMAGC